MTSEVDSRQLATETVPRTVSRRTYHCSHWQSSLSPRLRAEFFLLVGVFAGIAMVVLGLILPSSRSDVVVASPPDTPMGASRHTSGGPGPSTPADQPAPDMLVSPSSTAPGTPAASDTPARSIARTKQNAATPAPVNCADLPQRRGAASSYGTFTCPTYAGGGYGNGYNGYGNWYPGFGPRTRYR